MATDGFSEAENPRTGEMFGYDRLIAMADTTAGGSASEVATAFFNAIDDFSAGVDSAADDQTLLVVRRTEP